MITIVIFLVLTFVLKSKCEVSNTPQRSCTGITVLVFLLAKRYVTHRSGLGALGTPGIRTADNVPVTVLRNNPDFAGPNLTQQP